MSCSILSYTFPAGTNSYVFDVTVSGSTAPAISSSNTSVVEARYYSATTTGFRYELVNKGAGTATVTLRSQSGQTISIPVTGRALSTGRQHLRRQYVLRREHLLRHAAVRHVLLHLHDAQCLHLQGDDEQHHAADGHLLQPERRLRRYKGACDGGYLFTITNQGAGTATITTKDADGRTCSFTATGKATSSGGIRPRARCPCDTSSYTFTTLNAYTYKVTTNSTTPPTATSSNPSAVSVAYKGACEGGYLFTITNQGAGTATITTKDADGRTCSFTATGKATSSGGNTSSGTLPCDTSSYTFTTLNAYTYKVTTNSTTPPTATSSNPSAVSVAYKGACEGGYLFTITNQGAGTATITTKDADGRTCSFTATGKATSSGGNTSSGTLPCDTSSYTFTTLNAYTYKVTTNNATPPTATSSNPSAVSVAYKGACEGGYLFTITNQGAGTATITTKDADGRTCSFTATGKATSAGSSYSIKSDTTSQFSLRVGSTYTFKFTVTGGGSPQFASGNTSFLQLVNTVKEGNDYLVTFRGVSAGQVGVYASADGPSMSRQCIIDVV